MRRFAKTYLMSGPGGGADVVVMRDQTTDNHPREIVEQRPNRLQHCAADIFEVDVDPIGTGARERRGKIRRAMIDTSIKTELVRNVTALGFAPGDAEDAATLDLGDLTDHRTDCSRRSRDDHSLTCLWLTDIEQPDIGAVPGHPEYTKRRRDRRDGRIELAQVRAIQHRVGAPSRPGNDDVAFGVSGMVRGDHDGNGFPRHDTTERDRRRIRFPVIHPAAHVRDRAINTAREAAPARHLAPG